MSLKLESQSRIVAISTHVDRWRVRSVMISSAYGVRARSARIPIDTNCVNRSWTITRNSHSLTHTTRNNINRAFSLFWATPPRDRHETDTRPTRTDTRPTRTDTRPTRRTRTQVRTVCVHHGQMQRQSLCTFG